MSELVKGLRQWRASVSAMNDERYCMIGEAADEIKRQSALIETMAEALKLHETLARDDADDGNDLLWTPRYLEACEKTLAALSTYDKVNPKDTPA